MLPFRSRGGTPADVGNTIEDMEREILEPNEKALHINLDPAKFGTFAEIGAAQEVVRLFFQAGHAAATVAKSISAYDMAVSDAVYGPTDRYVGRRRLAAMLDHEYSLLLERLAEKRGAETTFFAFADTVATRLRSEQGKGRGWLGVRFQTEPKTEPSDILIHVRLLDPVSVREQEALGIMGVNLLYGAFYHHQDPAVLIGSLMDNLSRIRIEVDMVSFSGPAFRGVDNRLMILQLVEQELTDAAMFTAAGEAVEPSEILYHRPVLIERGSFRPVTNLTVDMLNHAAEQLHDDERIDEDTLVVLTEMTLHNLLEAETIDHRDFLARAEILGALGYQVMISNYPTFHRVTGYLRQHTPAPIGMVMGAAILKEIMTEKYYNDLEGGMLEALGRLFQGPVKLFVYPATATEGGELVTPENLQVPDNLRHLYSYLLDNGFIEPIRQYDTRYLHVLPGDVLAMIRRGEAGWEQLVPASAVERIRQEGLFGYKVSEQPPLAAG